MGKTGMIPTLRHIRLLSLALLLLLSPQAMAEDASPTLPAKFVRITSMADITDDGYYIIGGYGVNKTNVFFLSSISNGNNKLKAYFYGNTLEDLITEEQITNIWRFNKIGENVFYIQTSQDEKNIYAGKKGKSKETINDDGTDIGISADIASSWTISINEDKTFKIANFNVPKRFLSISEWSENTSYFANQVWNENEPGNLYIFKMATDFSQITGIAESPADGDRITFTTGKNLPTTKFTGQEVGDFMLHNGEVAPDERLASFTAATTSDGAFLLKNADGQFLQYSLKPSEAETEAKWQIYNGYIATFEKTPRYLVYINREHCFRVTTPYDATLKLATPTFFQHLGSEPELSNEAGLLTLTGAWSKERLAEVSFEDAAALDISGISLPVNCADFRKYPAEANIPIYVAEEDAELVPETWNFAVAGNRLLRETTLFDKKSIYIPKEITFEDGQISYKRTPLGDGGWETICLPFDAETPKEYTFESLEDIENNNLIFKDANQISRDIPLIFARRAGKEPGEMLVKAKAGSLKGYVNSGSEGFHGVYQRLNVESADENYYFLNEDGTTFVRAAKGSGLSPFRAYIRLNRTSNAPLYINFRATGISLPRTSTGKDTFTIDGRRADVHKAGKGLYISDGKKIIVSNP